MAITTTHKRPGPLGRKASKEVRRRQLIEATIDVLARRGFADLTLADVVGKAGLSRGIVNFHFESKDKLLTETLRFMARSYEDHWRAAIAKAGPSPAEQLWSVVEADFDKAVCNRKDIAAWSVLRAEAKSRPLYKSISGDHDLAFQSALMDLMAAVISQDGSDRDAHKLSWGLACLLEGLWLQILMRPQELSNAEAHAIAVEHLVALFPDHFSHKGPKTTRPSR